MNFYPSKDIVNDYIRLRDNICKTNIWQKAFVWSVQIAYNAMVTKQVIRFKAWAKILRGTSITAKRFTTGEDANEKIPNRICH